MAIMSMDPERLSKLEAIVSGMGVGHQESNELVEELLDDRDHQARQSNLHAQSVTELADELAQECNARDRWKAEAERLRGERDRWKSEAKARQREVCEMVADACRGLPVVPQGPRPVAKFRGWDCYTSETGAPEGEQPPTAPEHEGECRVKFGPSRDGWVCSKGTLGCIGEQP